MYSPPSTTTGPRSNARTDASAGVFGAPAMFADMPPEAEVPAAYWLELGAVQPVQTTTVTAPAVTSGIIDLAKWCMQDTSFPVGGRAVRAAHVNDMYGRTMSPLWTGGVRGGVKALSGVSASGAFAGGYGSRLHAVQRM